MVNTKQLLVATTGRGFYEISRELRELVSEAELETGLCHLFLHHTSASLIIMENADPAVLRDLENFIAKLAPDGDSVYEHQDEGPDDMPAHIRTALTHTDMMIPIRDSQLDLGTWQGVYIWEHRSAPHRRRVSVSLL